jgi:hypothetical protein
MATRELKIKLFIYAIILCNAVVSSYADEVIINRIKYKIDFDKNTASVIKNNGIFKKSIKGVVIIPLTINYNRKDYPVISIESGAFETVNLTTIIISEGITRIENMAFLNCNNFLINNFVYTGNLLILGIFRIQI